MSIGPTLETERLILRPPSAADLDAWESFVADPEVTAFLGGPQDRAIAWRQLCVTAGSWVINGFGMFSVMEKETGRWLGRLGPWRPEGWPGNEIGWGLAREAWGEGYAVEGAAATMDWAFETLGWTDVIHAIHPDNGPSRRLAERLGSRILRQAVLPLPQNEPVDIWGQTREEWLERRR
jgi:RimJ/RimL family protein N-acetyltransferase